MHLPHRRHCHSNMFRYRYHDLKTLNCHLNGSPPLYPETAVFVYQRRNPSRQSYQWTFSFLNFQSTSASCRVANQCLRYVHAGTKRLAIVVLLRDATPVVPLCFHSVDRAIRFGGGGHPATNLHPSIKDSRIRR
ncbi:hypothetical protein ACKS0A_01407 [Histoplasma ohiense]